MHTTRQQRIEIEEKRLTPEQVMNRERMWETMRKEKEEHRRNKGQIEAMQRFIANNRAYF